MPSVGMSPAVKAVAAQINKKYGDHTVMLGSEIIPMVDTITTGSLSFDAAMGGGWATNHWNEIVGQYSAGKTMVVLKTIAANQALNPKFTTVWFAAEDFHEPYAKMLGVDLTRVVIMEENLMQAVYESAINFVDTREVDMIVIDSYPALTTERELKGGMDEHQPGEAAVLTAKFLRKSNTTMKAPLSGVGRNLTGIVVNQWREKIGGYGNPRTTPGGKAKDFFYFQRAEVRRDEWIDNTKGEHIGQTIKLTNLKNKLSPPGRVGMVDAYFDRGNGFNAGEYDLTKDTISAAIAYEVIERSGRSTYTFDGESWPNRPRLEDALKDDDKVMKKVREAVLKVARGPS